MAMKSFMHNLHTKQITDASVASTPGHNSRARIRKTKDRVYGKLKIYPGGENVMGENWEIILIEWS